MSAVKTLIIDADSFAYTVAYYNQQALEAMPEEIEGDFEGVDEARPGSWAIEDIRSQLDQWMKINKCDSYEFHLTAGRKLAGVFEDLQGRPPAENFRYEIANDLTHGYKHNRTSDPVEGVEEVLEVMAREFNSVLHDRWEADDAVVALKQAYPDNIVLGAIDKDVLNQVEGIHFNYRKMEPHVTTKENAVRYAYWQCLVGDPGDGYKGVPGCGKVKADKLLTEGMTEKQMWNAVLTQYKLKSMSDLEAIATMRLANMHQLVLPKVMDIKEDPWHTKVELKLWTPPV